jgi:hypothetical protein
VTQRHSTLEAMRAHDFIVALTAPGAMALAAKWGVVVPADILTLADRFETDASALGVEQRQRLFAYTERALGSHLERFASYWWATEPLRVILSGELEPPPSLSAPEKEELLRLAREFIDGNTALQDEVDRLSDEQGYQDALADESPYPTLWAIIDLHRFKAMVVDLRTALGAEGTQRLEEWAQRLAGPGVDPPPLP